MTPPTVQPTARIFQTFCHINEYEEEGFANLHRMIATSEPLVLWAPSTQLLQAPQCRVSTDDFLEYVEAGRVRIVGRRDWLTSKDARDKAEEKWAGARWETGIDDKIKAIALEDQNLPNDDDKRVLIAPDERGNSYAKTYLEQHPEDVQRLSAELKDAEARNRLPKGLLGALKKNARDPQALATRLLRDVFNHGEAIHLASAEAPFFLAPRESKFLRLLDESLHMGVSVPIKSRTSSSAIGSRGAEPPDASLTTEDYAALTKEVFDILTALDRSRGNSLKGFVAGEGHAALSTWYRETCAQVQQRSFEYRTGVLIRDLQSKYESGVLDESLKEIFLSIDGLSGAAGIAFSVADWVSQGTITDFGLAGLAAGLVGAGHGALRALGYTKVGPKKPEWPFLYTFGHRPNQKEYETVAQALDRLSA
jgi:hypothetical protein